MRPVAAAAAMLVLLATGCAGPVQGADEASPAVPGASLAASLGYVPPPAAAKMPEARKAMEDVCKAIADIEPFPQANAEVNALDYQASHVYVFENLPRVANARQLAQANGELLAVLALENNSFMLVGTSLLLLEHAMGRWERAFERANAGEESPEVVIERARTVIDTLDDVWSYCP